MDAGTTSLSISDDDLTGQVAKSAARMQTRDCNGAGEFICGAGHCCNGYTHDCTNSQCTPKP